MASANVELVRSIFDAFKRGDFTRAAEWACADIEFVIADGPSPGRWREVSGLTDGWYGLLAAWEDFRIEVDEYRELDGERVLVLTQWNGRGKKSGIPVSMRCAEVFEIHRGKVTRISVYNDRDRALADLGLKG